MSFFTSHEASHQLRKKTNNQSKQTTITTHTCNSTRSPPFLPSYLNQTFYAKLMDEEQCTYKQKKTPSTDLRLPTSWNPNDKSKNIDIHHNGLGLSYIGPGKQETHAALVRSNYPMRPQCGLFYYEMKVISKGDDGYIGIGFCAATNKLERLPGWDPESWGYHGDDGHSFAGSGSGKTYGPCFTTGDIIGCGVSFAEQSAFYTKNGKFLGTAFTEIDLSKPVFPAIGLRTPGEEVITNFGHEPFTFDIAQYVTDQRTKYMSHITLTPRPQFDKKLTDQLVLSYLIHHGYTNTAKAVVQNAGQVGGQKQSLSLKNDLGQKKMEERQLIRTAILQGRFGEAMKLINTHFPGMLQQEGRGQELCLWLKQSEFVELMRNYTTRKSDANSMEVDDIDLLNRVMQYGKDLREEYRHDTQEKTRSSLVEIFSLLAYPDPYSSPVAHLMDTSKRVAVATEANAAILAYQDYPEIPALEGIYRQIILCNEELGREGHGKATLINMENYCRMDNKII